MRKGHRATGFTLIELSFSIVFIAMLLIAIATITTNMIATYRRGLILKQVNNYGTELVNDFKKSVANATITSFEKLCKSVYDTNASDCIDDEAKSLINFYDSAEIELDRNNISGSLTVPVHGAFCSGSYSYVWNSGYLFSETTVSTKPDANKGVGLKYKNSDNSIVIIAPSQLRLLKVLDPTHSICAATIATGYKTSGDSGSMLNRYKKESGDYYIDITEKTKITEEPTELLPGDGGNGNFAIYSLNVSVSDQDNSGRNAFYSGAFILGTIEGGVNIKASGDFCAPPGEYSQSEFDYCAINKFNFAMSATGE